MIRQEVAEEPKKVEEVAWRKRARRYQILMYVFMLLGLAAAGVAAWMQHVWNQEIYEQNSWQVMADEAESAIRQHPPGPLACFRYLQLAYAKGMQKKYAEALEAYARAKELEPQGFSEFSHATMLARIFFVAKDYEQSEKIFADIIVARPKTANPYLEYAWLLATVDLDEFRDGDMAVHLANTGCELTHWESYHALSVLAAAHAEKGEFKEAAQRQQAALARLEQEPDSPSKESQKRRLHRGLTLYTAHVPWRVEREKVSP